MATSRSPCMQRTSESRHAPNRRRRRKHAPAQPEGKPIRRAYLMRCASARLYGKPLEKRPRKRPENMGSPAPLRPPRAEARASFGTPNHLFGLIQQDHHGAARYSWSCKEPRALGAARSQGRSSHRSRGHVGAALCNFASLASARDSPRDRPHNLCPHAHASVGLQGSSWNLFQILR
jgi:hypothetical protein